MDTWNPTTQFWMGLLASCLASFGALSFSGKAITPRELVTAALFYGLAGYAFSVCTFKRLAYLEKTVENRLAYATLCGVAARYVPVEVIQEAIKKFVLAIVGGISSIVSNSANSSNANSNNSTKDHE